MSPQEKVGQHPASEALVRLRKLMKMSQAEFAIKVLDMAPISVYRLEKVAPPQGAMLFKLIDIADIAAYRDPAMAVEFKKMAQEFRKLYVNELEEKIGITSWRNLSAHLVSLEKMVEKAKQTNDFEAVRTTIGDALKEVSVVADRINGIRGYLTAEILMLEQRKDAFEKESGSEAKWQSTDAKKSGGSSSNSAASKSAKARTRKAARKR